MGAGDHMQHSKAALALIALAIMFSLVFVPSVQAVSQISFGTTAQWDTGSKFGIDTATQSDLVSANRITLNATGGYYGIGNGVTGLDKSGSPYLPAPTASYDMQTWQGGKLKDFSGNGHNGNGFSVTNTSGCPLTFCNNALNFNGGGQRVELGTGLHFVSGGKWTISMWAMIYSTTSQWLFMKPFTSHISPYYQFSIGLGDGQTGATDIISIELWQSGGFSLYQAIDGHTLIAPNIWYMITATIDLSVSAHKIVCLFINGSADGCSLSSGGSYTDYNSVSTIGSNHNAPSSGWNGRVDEFSFWNGTAFTSTQIASLYNSGKWAFSGHWQSPYEDTPGQYPSQVSITLGNRSSSFLSEVTLVNVNDSSVIWGHVTDNFYSGTFMIPVTADPSSFNGTWMVELMLFGIGTSTAYISNLTLTLSPIPATISPAQLQSSTVLLIILIVALIVLLALGLLLHPVFFIMGAICGFALAFEAYTLTSDILTSGVVAGMSLLLLVIGIVAKPKDRSR